MEVPVLVVGGGPVGLCAFIALARQGIDCLLVERHPGTAIHPKARGLNARTMEVFRGWGIDETVRRAGLPPEDHGFFYRGRTLVGPDFERTGGGGLSADVEALSPSTWMVISQDALEPVLLNHARSLAPDGIRFGWELRSCSEGPDGVEARIVERASDREITVRAAYLVGADGAASIVREQSGIELVGHGPLVHNVSILFRADLAAAVADRRSAVYYIAPERDIRPRGYPMSVGNPPADGVFLTVNGTDRWLLVVAAIDDSAPDGGLDAPQAQVAVRRAVGLPDLDVEVLSLMSWTPAARVAERYGTDRVFLAGDAAHEMTPSGAFGLNTGIQDADDLAWKLGAVIQGWAGERLLTTYAAERRPVGAFTSQTSYELFAGTRPPRPFGNWGVIFGAVYASSAIVADGTPAPAVEDPVVQYVPVARPGHRTPHAWLVDEDGARISTLDLFGRGFTLISRSAAWIDVATRVAHRESLPLRAERLGGRWRPQDPERFDDLYGIGDGGAVLVRPDGYVCWRTTSGEASDEILGGVVALILDRPAAA